MSGVTTYEAIDDRIAAEAIMVDHSLGLEIVDEIGRASCRERV